MVYPARYRNATPVPDTRVIAPANIEGDSCDGGAGRLPPDLASEKCCCAHRMVKGLSKDVSVKSCVLLSGNSRAPGKRLNVPLVSLLLSFTDERAVVPRALWANFLRGSHSGVDPRNIDPGNAVARDR